MAGARGRPDAAVRQKLTLRQLLFTQPRRFEFDAAVGLLLRMARNADPAKAVRFRSPAGLAFPPADIPVLREGESGGAPARATVGVMGLTGPSGVLPRRYSESVTATRRDRSHALHDFLDMLSHRLVAMFARAGVKYRPARSAGVSALAAPPRADPAAAALLALTGYATPHMADRLEAGADPLLHYSGFFSAHPRSAERLQSFLSDWLGQAVCVEQFAGVLAPAAAGRPDPLGARRVAGAWSRLGVDAAIGVRAWNLQGRVVLRIGPMSRAAFEALLPDRPVLSRLVSLVRAFLPPEIEFAVNPVLDPAEVPTLVLDAAADPRPRLGWNTWLPLSAVARQQPAGDASFEESVIQNEARSR